MSNAASRDGVLTRIERTLRGECWHLGLDADSADHILRRCAPTFCEMMTLSTDEMVDVIYTRFDKATRHLTDENRENYA